MSLIHTVEDTVTTVTYWLALALAVDLDIWISISWGRLHFLNWEDAANWNSNRETIIQMKSWRDPSSPEWPLEWRRLCTVWILYCSVCVRTVWNSSMQTVCTILWYRTVHSFDITPYQYLVPAGTGTTVIMRNRVPYSSTSTELCYDGILTVRAGWWYYLVQYILYWYCTVLYSGSHHDDGHPYMAR